MFAVVQNVPFVDLSRLTREIAPAVERDWSERLAACDFVDGPPVATLETHLAHRLGVPHVVACANGTDALVLGLLALGVRPGSLVALPNLTFWATYEAVRAVGAVPLLIDVDADDLQMSLAEFIRAHDEHRFDTAILVHLFGWASSRLVDFRSLCHARGIRLLEDGAQSFGVSVAGVPVLVGSTMGTLSFYPAKVIGGCADGGAVTCASEEHAAALRSLRNHGRAGAYEHQAVGVNSRMGSLAAAYLLHVVGAADRILAHRRRSLARYGALLAGHPTLRLQGPPAGVSGNGYLAVVTDTQRDGEALAASLRGHGVGCARTYPVTVADQPGARGAWAWGALEVSRAFCKRVVNPPLFYGITDEEIGRAVEALS